jgi:hypothetical protein
MVETLVLSGNRMVLRGFPAMPVGGLETTDGDLSSPIKSTSWVD